MISKVVREKKLSRVECRWEKSPQWRSYKEYSIRDRAGAVLGPAARGVYEPSLWSSITEMQGNVGARPTVAHMKTGKGLNVNTLNY